MTFGGLASSLLVASWGACSYVNYATHKYIKNTYDTSKSLYFIMAFDAGFTTMMSVVNVLIFTIQSFVPNLGLFGCSVMTFSTTVVPKVQPFLNTFISYIRYMRIKLNLPNGWKPEEELINVSAGILVFAVAYNGLLAMINTIFDMNWFSIYDFCLHRGESEDTVELFGWILGLFPVIVAAFATAVLDWKSFKMLEGRQEDLNDKVAKRASNVSLAFTIPYAMAPMTFGRPLYQLDAVTISLIIHFTGIGLTALRNPVIAACAVQLNEINQRVDAEQAVEARRQLEIKEALNAREERKRGRETDVVTISACVDQTLTLDKEKRRTLNRKCELPDVQC